MLNLLLLNISESESTSEGGSSGGGSLSQLKNIFKSPTFYVVIGVIVLLIIVFYLVRRVVKNRGNTVTIIVRHGNIYRVLDKNNPKYFLKPFLDKVGATISLDDREFNSDKLFINDGPDALYKINFTLKYHVTDPVKYYPYGEKINDLILARVNEDLREYADKGNASVLIKDYREHNQDIISLINKALEPYFLEVTSYKVNLIEPMGRK